MSGTFLPQYAKLELKVRKAVDAAIAKFAEHTHAGLHLEKINHARDPRIRTIRIDQYWRGVVLAPEQGDVFCLITVLGHDEAIQYAASRLFTVNQVLGVIEVRDQDAIDSLEPVLEQVSLSTDARLFTHVSDKEMARLGIDDTVMPVVRLLINDVHLQAMEKMLPEPQYIALLALAQGMTVQQAWAEVAACLPPEVAPASVAPDDLVTAMRRTPDRIVFIEGPADLRRILDESADQLVIGPAVREPDELDRHRTVEVQIVTAPHLSHAAAADRMASEFVSASDDSRHCPMISSCHPHPMPGPPHTVNGGKVHVRFPPVEGEGARPSVTKWVISSLSSTVLRTADRKASNRRNACPYARCFSMGSSGTSALRTSTLGVEPYVPDGVLARLMDDRLAGPSTDLLAVVGLLLALVGRAART